MMTVDTFSFHSGGRYHYRGFGEWIVRLDRNGQLHVEHHVAGQEKLNQEFSLSHDDNETCWARIDAASIPSLEPSNRPGVPDEPEYRFILQQGESMVNVRVWANDAGDRAVLKELVDHVKAIIMQHAHQVAVI